MATGYTESTEMTVHYHNIKLFKPKAYEEDSATPVRSADERKIEIPHS